MFLYKIREVVFTEMFPINCCHTNKALRAMCGKYRLHLFFMNICKLGLLLGGRKKTHVLPWE